MIEVRIGDSRRLIHGLNSESIDLIVTSPPYNIGKDYGIYKDELQHSDYILFMDEIIKECFRVLVLDGRIAINISHVVKYQDQNKQFPIVDFLELLLKNGFNIREIISWFKATDENHFSGGSTAWGSWRSASNPHMRGQVESIIVANKSSWKKESGSKISDITAEEFKLWTKTAWFFHAESNRLHPAPFPIDLPLRIIKLYSFVGDTILDPFCGSGTTLLACRMTKRNGIGFELNPEYKKLIEDRAMLKVPELSEWCSSMEDA